MKSLKVILEEYASKLITIIRTEEDVEVAIRKSNELETKTISEIEGLVPEKKEHDCSEAIKTYELENMQGFNACREQTLTNFKKEE